MKNGSEKQIKYAEQIRNEKKEELKIKLEYMIKENKNAPAEQIEKIKSQLAMALEAMEKEDDAIFWIDNRCSVSGDVAKQAIARNK